MKDHIYPKEKTREDLVVFEAQLAKENIEEYFWQKVSTHDHEESTHEDMYKDLNLEIMVSTHGFEESTHDDSAQRFESGNKGVDTWL